jgi:hypothetical protein
LAQQVLSYSKMEAKLQNKEIIEKTAKTQLDSKRVFKNARTGYLKRVAKANME